MSDLEEAFEKAKTAEEEKAHKDQKCLICFNLKCTCEPAKMYPLFDQPFDCGSGL